MQTDVAHIANVYDHLIEFQFRRVEDISCQSVYAYMYGCYDHYFNRVIRWHTAMFALASAAFVHLSLLAGIDNEYDMYFNEFPYEWMDSKWTIIGVTLLMQTCRKIDDNIAIWMTNGMEVMIVTLWLYIGQHDEATRDGLVMAQVTSPRLIKFL